MPALNALVGFLKKPEKSKFIKIGVKMPILRNFEGIFYIYYGR